MPHIINLHLVINTEEKENGECRTFNNIDQFNI